MAGVGQEWTKISTRAELCNGQNPSDRDTSKYEQRGVGTYRYQDVPQKNKSSVIAPKEDL